MDLNERKEEKWPSNSYSNIRSKPLNTEPKKQETPKPIAKGTLQKPSLSRRIAESFISVSGEDVKDAVIFDWVIPGVKGIALNIVNMLLFGKKTDPRINRSGGESTFGSIPYHKIFSSSKSEDKPVINSSGRDPIITLPSREVAEEVLVKMFEELERYNRVTVKYLYSLVDIPTDFAKANWGWRNLTGSSVVQTRNGDYRLKLPKVEELR